MVPCPSTDIAAVKCTTSEATKVMRGIGGDKEITRGRDIWSVGPVLGYVKDSAGLERARRSRWQPCSWHTSRCSGA